jgi:hypothetical protein
MAILQADDHCLLLAQIYRWISNSFPFYNLAESGWRNTIRHNLSLNKDFIKIKRPSHYPGKGHYWRIKPGHEHQLMYEVNVDRSPKPIGNSGRRHDAITCSLVNAGRPAAPTAEYSTEEFYSDDNTIKTYPQQAEDWTRVTVENSGRIPEQKSSHSPSIPLTLTPLLFSQPHRRIETSSPRKVCPKHRIEKSLKLEPGEFNDVFKFTPPDDTPVTHVYLPHVMRHTDDKCRQFKAHRAESEILRIRRARMERLRSTSHAQNPT